MFHRIKKMFHIHVGLRIVKTVLAAFICMFIDYFRGQIPLQSVITMAICMGSDTEETVSNALHRLGATLVGSLFGISFLFLFTLFPQLHALLYYALLCLALIPLILVVVAIKCTKGVAVAMVAFLSITLLQSGTTASWSYALNRIIDMLVGILVAFPINMLIPNHSKNKVE